jgi:hypothetical protein
MTMGRPACQIERERDDADQHQLGRRPRSAVHCSSIFARVSGPTQSEMIKSIAVRRSTLLL